jgi:hypothetical protein
VEPLLSRDQIIIKEMDVLSGTNLSGRTIEGKRQARGFELRWTITNDYNLDVRRKSALYIFNIENKEYIIIALDVCIDIVCSPL